MRNMINHLIDVINDEPTHAAGWFSRHWFRY
jgi:hypothetical protein